MSTVTLQSPDERGVIVQMLESGYRFVLGSIGGGVYKIFLIFLLDILLDINLSLLFVPIFLYILYFLILKE